MPLQENAPEDRWLGLNPTARASLGTRDYRESTLAERLAGSGVPAGELTSPAARAELSAAWIPGVELFRRPVYAQRHRGHFAEFARRTEGPLAALGFWPEQWASARMFAGTAKGFHIHPPHVPAGHAPTAWFAHLFGQHPAPATERPYPLEQWDVMFFIQGAVEMILVDERLGLLRRVMRFLIEGDNFRSAHNVGVVIPPGVAHALRVEGSQDLIMVYGTSTTFDPANEGRLAAGVEAAPLPPEWKVYLDGPGAAEA